MTVRSGLFFDPVRQCVPGHAEDAADASHPGTFLRRPKDVFPAFRAVRVLGSQDANRPAVFAQILLTAAAISSIVDNIETAACATLMLHRRDDHVTIFFESSFVDKKIHLSFIVYHYRKIYGVIFAMISSRYKRR